MPSCNFTPAELAERIQTQKYNKPIKGRAKLKEGGVDRLYCHLQISIKRCLIVYYTRLIQEVAAGGLHRCTISSMYAHCQPRDFKASCQPVVRWSFVSEARHSLGCPKSRRSVGRTMRDLGKPNHTAYPE